MIKVNTGFEMGSIEAIDARIVLTSEQMLNINDNTQPDIYFAMNLDDGKLYIYDKSATPNETTGKFSILEGGSNNIWSGTKEEYEAEKDDIPEGTLIIITDDEGEIITNVFADVTQEEYDALPDTKLTDGIAYIISEEDSTTAKFVRNGKEISGGESIQVLELPEITDDNKDKVYEYVGETTDDYIKGHFYEAKEKTAMFYPYSTDLTVNFREDLPDFIFVKNHEYVDNISVDDLYYKTGDERGKTGDLAKLKLKEGYSFELRRNDMFIIIQPTIDGEPAEDPDETHLEYNRLDEDSATAVGLAVTEATVLEWTEVKFGSDTEIVTEWEDELSDEKVPSEKLVKETIENLVTIDTEQTITGEKTFDEVINTAYIAGTYDEEEELNYIFISPNKEFESGIYLSKDDNSYSIDFYGNEQSFNFNSKPIGVIEDDFVQTYTTYSSKKIEETYAIQKEELPAAKSSAGKIYQYIGETNENYTKGHFYESIEDSKTSASFRQWIGQDTSDAPYLNLYTLENDTVSSQTLYYLLDGEMHEVNPNEVSGVGMYGNDYFKIRYKVDIMHLFKYDKGGISTAQYTPKTWTEVEFGGGSDGVFTPDANATTVAVGGVPKGYDFTDKEYTINEVLNMIFFPYVAFTYTALAGGGSYEYGKEVTISKVTPTYEAGSKAITTVSVGTTAGSNDLYEGTSYASGAITLTTSKTFDGTTGGKVYCKLSDGTTTLEQSTTVSYVKSIYYATTDSATVAPTSGTKGNNVDITVAADNYIYFLCPDTTKTQIQQYAVGQWNNVDTTYVGEVEFTNSENAALTYHAYRTPKLAAMTGKFQIK